MNIEERIRRDLINLIVDYKDYRMPYIYDEDTDKYFPCVDVMEDFYKDNNMNMPQYAYGCEFVKFELDLDNILDNASDDFDEDILDRLEGHNALNKAIEEFNKTNEDIGSYYVDYSTVVKLF